MLTVAPRTLGQCIDELVVSPCANAGYRIGCEVWSGEVAKWCFDNATASKVATAARESVASRAIANRREIVTAFDLSEVLTIDTSRPRCERI